MPADNQYCFLNDKIIPLHQAGISPLDIGFLRGFGIFEGIRTYHGRPFLLKDHLQRLGASAKACGFKLPYSDQEISHIIDRVLRKNKFVESSIRPIVTGGLTNSDGMSSNGKDCTFLILVQPLADYPDRIYTQGVTLVTCDYERPFPKIKSLNYFVAAKLNQWRRQQDAFELLYVKNDFVLECETSNIFIIKKAALITPRDNILAGCSRNLVLQLAKDVLRIEQRAITLAELLSADEAFITSSYKEIVPVVKVNSGQIADGRVGNKTAVLMQLFRHYTQKISNEKS